jgi:hypothetical protein
MGINFPASPTDGQVFNASPGVSFVAAGGRWRPAPLKTALPKNYVVNPAMQVSQENGTTAGTVTGYYPADQWIASFVSSSTINWARVVTATNPQGQLNVSASPAETAAAAGEYVQSYQKIEGSRTVEFQFGSATSKQAVIAFDVSVPVAGTYWVNLALSGGAYSFLVPYTISVSEVATWVRKQVIVPAGAINAGTWPTDDNPSATVHFAFHCGSTFTGVAGFQAGNFVAGPGQALGLSTAAVCAFTNVGMYLDPYLTGVAPSFVVPEIGDETRRCQRYWYRSYGTRGNAVSAVAANQLGAPHPVPMRDVPALAVVGSPIVNEGTVSPVVTAINSNQSNTMGLEINAATTTLTFPKPLSHIYNAVGNYFAVNARM